MGLVAEQSAEKEQQAVLAEMVEHALREADADPSVGGTYERAGVFIAGALVRAGVRLPPGQADRP